MGIDRKVVCPDEVDPEERQDVRVKSWKQEWKTSWPLERHGEEQELAVIS